MSNEYEFSEVVERVKDALAGAGTTTGATMFPTETADEQEFKRKIITKRLITLTN